MAFKLSEKKIQAIAQSAYIADREIRLDFHKGNVADEDNYTSLFTGTLRRILNTHPGADISVESFKLKGSMEQKTGCDATIIIRQGALCKIALFEAKWPIEKSKPRRWDYAQTSTGLSHFTDQLRRQSNVVGNFAIFEMFYSDDDFNCQKDFMNDETSTCVWHEDTLKYCLSRTDPDSFWKLKDLEALLKTNRLNIAQILEAICRCLKGKPLKYFDPHKMIEEYGFPPDVTVIDCTPKD